MKAVWTLALSVVLLAGCGTAPSATAPQAATGSARASGLFSGLTFKEAAYRQVTLDELSNIYDEPEGHDGEKVKATGFVGARTPAFGLGEYTITLFDEQQSASRATLFTGSSAFSSKARKLDKELHAGTHEVVTVYLDVDAEERFEVRAVRYSDGKLKTL